MTRLPIRVRLAAAFAVALLLVLTLAALFLHLRLQDSLNEGIKATLTARMAAVVALEGDPERRLPARFAGEPEEGFAQILAPDGTVLDRTGRAEQPALTDQELSRARAGAVVIERRVKGIDGTARMFAQPAGGNVAVVGQTLQDRDEILSGFIASFAIGGPVAAVLASLLGYALAATALRPVEAMRRRAEGVSLGGEQSLLPLPEVKDEIHRLGVTLNEMLVRLRQAFDRERQFVADASHELRTPVSVIKAELEGALRSGDYGPEVRDALVASVAECDQLGQLAEDLLVLAAAGEGQLPVRPEEGSARDALDLVRARFADRAAHAGREIRVEVDNGLRVRADPLMLRQALGNLVDNSLRHGQGDVALRARADEAATEIEVSDSGAGFGPDLALTAFERFTRGDAARTRGGSGLGLAIVRAVVEAHGGSAEIEPDGRRATVRLRLPHLSQGDLR